MVGTQGEDLVLVQVVVRMPGVGVQEHDVLEVGDLAPTATSGSCGRRGTTVRREGGDQNFFSKKRTIKTISHNNFILLLTCLADMRYALRVCKVPYLIPYPDPGQRPDDLLHRGLVAERKHDGGGKKK